MSAKNWSDTLHVLAVQLSVYQLVSTLVDKTITEIELYTFLTEFS